jgi:hypothetical protein
MIWLLLACVQVELRSANATGSIDAKPSHVVVAPVGGEDCPAVGCCGAADPDAAVSTRTCCGSFELTLEGTDTLTSLSWTPGSQSRLDVVDDVYGNVALDRGGVVLPICYRLVGDKPPRCGASPDDPGCETGLPPDDGLLELAFREAGAIDVWIEVSP